MSIMHFLKFPNLTYLSFIIYLESLNLFVCLSIQKKKKKVGKITSIKVQTSLLAIEN